MGYALTGYPSRSDKRRRRIEHRFHAYDGDRRGRKGKERVQEKSSVEERRVVSLQDLPVEILERIYVFSQDLTLMRSLNKYFYHNLRPSTHLMAKFMWETYSLDLRELLADNKIYLGDDKAILVDSMFDSKIFFDFFRNNYYELPKLFYFIPGWCLNEDGSLIHPDVAVKVIMGLKSHDFPGRFYTAFDNFFLHGGMMDDLGYSFYFERGSHLVEDLLQWVFTEFPPYVKNYDQIEAAISVAYGLTSMSCDFSSGPLLVLLQVLFENKDPPRLQAFVDRLFEEETNDSRIKLFDTFVMNYYSEEADPEDLSDPMLWAELRRLSNMALIEIIERYGGVPQYDVFF
ncbi:hypothetical protein HG537_0G01530 [Torulaspora globosa]|uniref:F-box domain-containing protein n=1 Tax=Torulaspora globosa TaxID=48254 RepID=A0A7H9HXE4_9SACH|nr:hypothetical protein HG537_0G01530 [Torulaspora sp. CBS 2947]